MAKHIGIGLLLTLQFFSTFPVKKNLPMKKAQLNAMYILLPMLGLLFGGILAMTALLIRETTSSGSLLLALILVVLSLALSGGLHMDGLADVADAFFSYKEKEKRLEIMGDPRIGAFGAMALIVMIAGKLIIVSETALTVSLWMILFIPAISRIGLLLIFSSTQSAKSSGLAAFFQSKTDYRKIARWGFLWFVLIMAAAAMLVGWQLTLVIILSFTVASLWYRNWCMKHFGGVTGDLFGTYIEGMELLLWILLLFFI
ncbi:adenosylcobinamide-GDP ribazoletransferase [Planomicrobium sp. MB-3u-38]|uniref:adenosylcobinamide-GDP ribazoletransferase n=1 Tax=Planomicrobium sp. MB-3u-38 TaxID=2058318 RepID=UPI000C7B1625|nr:adenosylcobinamide-GDP ribazoletransferase [Planomicrobium sp. MB-3u-38]PKH11841.1 adenosylcobinamide-GDP ribazoletransferase [Planomicrobium sp. MB-3u-38]